MSTPDALGRELWDAAVALAGDPAGRGRSLEWAIATVTAVTAFADPTNPPAPAAVGIRGTGAGTGAAGEALTFVYGSFVPIVGDRVLLCRMEGSMYLVEDILPL